MADVVILYHSEHHGNTKKLVEAIAQAHAVDVLDVSEAGRTDLSRYRAVGFASGVYYSKLHASLSDFLDGLRSCKGMKAFVLYTCGSPVGNPAASFEEKLGEKGFGVLGVYRCLGYDTFGPFRLVGGIAKGHPTGEEIAGAVRFFEQTVL